MYLMHSAASSAVWPFAFNQSIKRAASVAVMLGSILSSPPAGHICLAAGRVISKPPPVGRAAFWDRRAGLRSAGATASAFRWLIGQPVRVGGASCSVVKVLAGCARRAWLASFRLVPAVFGPARGLSGGVSVLALGPWPVRFRFRCTPADGANIARCTPEVKPFLQNFFRGGPLLPVGE